jgi:hypothetical protein
MNANDLLAGGKRKKRGSRGGKRVQLKKAQQKLIDTHTRDQVQLKKAQQKLIDMRTRDPRLQFSSLTYGKTIKFKNTPLWGCSRRVRMDFVVNI